jgi:DNA/RNA-binding domain of Phe-tRNA-synthetase-like protein
MIDVAIDPALTRLVPGLRLGVVQADRVQVRKHDPALWAMLEELGEHLRHRWAGHAAADRSEIAATRRAYRALGDDPTRYRPANEALLRRVLSQRALPQINTVVDINNFVSLDSGWPLGCYDLQQIEGSITARRGSVGETYDPIGKVAVDAEHRLVLADARGIFGSPTADGQRTQVTEATDRVLFVVFAFEAEVAAVQQATARVARLLAQWCGATGVEERVVGV